jgi:hypothetical protein
MSLWREHFHWQVVLRWDVLSYEFGTLLVFAGFFLAFDQYDAANVCFILAGMLLLAKFFNGAVTAPDPALHRIAFVFVCFGIVGVGMVETVRGVNAWAAKKRSTQAEKPATSSEIAPIADRIPTDGARNSNNAVVAKAKPYPDIEASISGTTATIFVANHVDRDMAIRVRTTTYANRFDQKSLTSRPMPPPIIDLGVLKRGRRVEVTSMELKDELEEACVITAYFGSSDAVGGVYRVYFRKPTDEWQIEYTLHDDYNRRKLYQRGGSPENVAEKRRRIRYRLSQLIMQGNMLKQGFSWLVMPAGDEKSRQRIDPTEKLATMSLEIQNWKTEAIFWTQWELGDSYVALLTNPEQSSQYPRGLEELPTRDHWHDTWDTLTSHQTKLEEFLKELPEL